MTAFISGFDANLALDIVLLAMLVVLVGAIASTRRMLAAVILMGVYSLVSGIWLMVMDAPDVAFTEAVVGAGVSTIILLGAILLARGEAAKVDRRRLVLPGILATLVGAVLVYAALGLPDFGDPTSPANAYVGRVYLAGAGNDTGIPNVVTAVLASYRGFDTLGETVVIFAAAIGVAIMLGFGERAMADRAIEPLAGGPADHHVVLRVAAKLLIPIIALYAFYVQFHGDLGPGGGFQAGVILAVAVILHALVFGLKATMAAIKPKFARGMAALGVLLYAGIGVVCIVNGGGFLDYDYLFPRHIEAQIPDWILGPSDPAHPHLWGRHFGIMAIELGVLFTVAAAMVTIFYGFAGRLADAPKSDVKKSGAA